MEQPKEKELLKDGKMTALNWMIVFGGLVVFILGFAVMAAVGDAHHGFKGFLAPFMLIFGMLIVIGGFIYHPRKNNGVQ